MAWMNGIDIISETDGPYVVLCDYGYEGLEVVHQSHTVEDAIAYCNRSLHYGPLALVKMVDFPLTTEEADDDKG